MLRFNDLQSRIDVVPTLKQWIMKICRLTMRRDKNRCWKEWWKICPFYSSCSNAIILWQIISVGLSFSGSVVVVVMVVLSVAAVVAASCANGLEYQLAFRWLLNCVASFTRDNKPLEANSRIPLCVAIICRHCSVWNMSRMWNWLLSYLCLVIWAL